MTSRDDRPSVRASGTDATSRPQILDWHSAPLSDDTVIDARYRSTQNVRRYFASRLGADFKMSRPFMAWIKSNPGQTLADACAKWTDMQNEDRP
ncbi:MAG: DUF6434 domain-containing protein [Pseudomonadota bacterium]